MIKYIVGMFICVCLTACTISFQNVDTHGTATDLIDENMRTDPDISPDITVPIKPM